MSRISYLGALSGNVAGDQFANVPISAAGKQPPFGADRQLSQIATAQPSRRLFAETQGETYNDG